MRKEKFKRFLRKFFLELEKIEKEKRELLFKKFFSFLAKKPNFLKISLKELKKYRADKKIKLLLARKLDEEALSKIKEKLKKIFGKDDFQVILDDDILAGFLALDKNFRIDASLKGVLETIKNKWMS